MLLDRRFGSPPTVTHSLALLQLSVFPNCFFCLLSLFFITIFLVLQDLLGLGQRHIGSWVYSLGSLVSFSSVPPCIRNIDHNLEVQYFCIGGPHDWNNYLHHMLVEVIDIGSWYWYKNNNYYVKCGEYDGVCGLSLGSRLNLIYLVFHVLYSVTCRLIHSY